MAVKKPTRAVSFSRPKAFSRVFTENKELSDVQDRVADAVDGLSKNPMLRGKILEGIVIGDEEVIATTGETTISPVSVAHGLGKCPRGWQIVDRDGPARVWKVAWDANTITLQSDEKVTVSISVF